MYIEQNMITHKNTLSNIKKKLIYMKIKMYADDF